MHELTKLRQKKKMTMRQLAVLARVHHSTVSRVESGKSVPTAPVAMALAAELGARGLKSQKRIAFAIIQGEEIA